MSGKQFPILDSERDQAQWNDLGMPRSISWSIISPHESQAQWNHSQSLECLARRGGLCPLELLAVLQDKQWREVRHLTVEETWNQLKPLLGAALKPKPAGEE